MVNGLAEGLANERAEIRAWRWAMRTTADTARRRARMVAREEYGHAIVEEQDRVMIGRSGQWEDEERRMGTDDR